MSAPDRTWTDTPYRDPTMQHAHGSALFGGSAVPAPDPWPTVALDHDARRSDAVDYSAIRDSAAFAELRGRLLRFTVPVTVLFMANFMMFVLLSAYMPEFMGTPVIGLINVGLLVGVFQFITTVAVVVIYNRYARERVDPLADRIRDEVEGA